MNRTRQLKLLDEEIRRLFSEGISENDIFDQLSFDSRFDFVRRDSIQSLYKKLQKDAVTKAKKKELNDQKLYSQNANNLLLFEAQSIKNTDTCFDGIWKDRYFLTSKLDNDQMHTYKVFDLYQNISTEISFPFAGDLADTRVLKDQFALINEVKNGMQLFYLAYLDLINGYVKIVQEIKNGDCQPSGVKIFDFADQSKFAIEWVSDQDVFSIVTYSLSCGMLSIGEEVVLEDPDLVLSVGSYTNNQLVGLKFEEGHLNEINHGSVFVQDLHGEKKFKLTKLDLLPENIYAQWPLACYRWYHNHFFLTVQFRSTELCGIAFINLHVQKWSVLEFAIKSPIVSMEFIDNRSLLICEGKYGKEVNREQVSKIYKLPINKPELLRHKAWFTIVKSFKKKQVDDPYEQARKFLPFNSDIQSLLNVADREPNDGQKIP